MVPSIMNVFPISFTGGGKIIEIQNMSTGSDFIYLLIFQVYLANNLIFGEFSPFQVNCRPNAPSSIFLFFLH